MSHQTNQPISPMIFDGFAGVDQTRAHKNEPLSSALVNFRILPDGSIEKRCGYRLLNQFPNPIRAFWSGIIDGVPTGFVVHGNRLERIRLTNGETTPLATLTTYSGNACLFYWDQTLYLMDSEDLYQYNGIRLQHVSGYIPLIGKDWVNNYVGEPYEPMNILSRQVRISYVINPELVSNLLFTPEPVESVQAVFKNGIRLSEDEYYIYEPLQTVNVRSVQGNDRILIYMTLKGNATDQMTDLLRCNQAMVFESPTAPRLFFWNDRQLSPMICSSYVEKAKLEVLKSHGFSGKSLYIPKGSEFMVGDGHIRIQGAVRQQDDLMIFTEKSTWKADALVSGLTEIPTVNIHSNVGCTSPSGIVLADNDPVVFDKRSVRRLTQSSGQSDLYHSHSLSVPIEPLLQDADVTDASLFYHQQKEELWMALPAMEAIWIYQFQEKRWFQFQGIGAYHMFDVNGSVGFLTKNGVFVLDETIKLDQIGKESFREIVAKAETNLLDFGTVKKKSLSEVILRGDLDKGEVRVSIVSPEIPSVTRTLKGIRSHDHAILKLRLPSGRFSAAKITLTAKGSARQRIHGMELHLHGEES